jgi:hypothetical protein
MKPVLSRRSLLFGAGSTVVGWLAWLVGAKRGPGQTAAASPAVAASPPPPPAWPWAPPGTRTTVTYEYRGPLPLVPGPHTTVTTYLYDPDRGSYFPETGREAPTAERGRS